MMVMMYTVFILRSRERLRIIKLTRADVYVLMMNLSFILSSKMVLAWKKPTASLLKVEMIENAPPHLMHV